MEKGKIRSITSYNGGGTIADLQGQVINFSSSSFVGRNRSALKSGDLVWFERAGSVANASAINVRKC